jgi:hypothetical protein
MSDGPRAPDDTDRSMKLERWGGLVVVASIALMVLIGLTPGIKFLFWVPFAVGIGIVLPALAILADRDRDRDQAGEA